jgi:hypothetical protein
MTGRPLSVLLDEAAGQVRPLSDSVLEDALGTADRRRRNKRVVMPLAAAALVILAVAATSLGGGPKPVQVAASGAPQLPRQLEDHSYLTANLGDAPPGRVIAALNYWPSLEDVPRLALVGAQGNSYRLIPDADGGMPGMHATHISRDGTLIATEVPGGIALIDARTGKVRRLNIGGWCCEGRILGFSPDASTIAVRLPISATVPPAASLSPSDEDAVVHLVDVRTAAVTRLGKVPAQKAAFSPDGEVLAVSGGGKLRLFSRTGKLLGEQKITGDVAGANAWTPDGRFIATVPEPDDRSEPSTLEFVPADPAHAAGAPEALTVDNFDVLLGWRSDRTAVVGQWRPYGGDLTEVGLRDGRQKVLATAPAPFDVVAAGLLPDLVIVDSAWPDHGPLPTWARVGAVVLTLAGALIALIVWRTVKRRRAALLLSARFPLRR